MKTLSSILVILSLTVSLFAAPRCERLEFYDMDNLHASFENDLLSNVWQTNILGSMSNLYFEDDGLVTAVPVGTERVESYMWSLVTNQGTASLSLFSPTTEKEFIISPTCNGLSAMSHGKSTPMLISAEVRMTDTELEFVRAQLTGTWHYHAQESETTHPAQSSMTLSNDGTFNLRTGPDSYHSVHEGVWQISQDGRYLILYTQMYIGQERKYVAESIRLKSFDFEDMVIDAQSLPRALQQYSGKQVLYLEKARA